MKIKGKGNHRHTLLKVRNLLQNANTPASSAWKQKSIKYTQQYLMVSLYCIVLYCIAFHCIVLWCACACV